MLVIVVPSVAASMTRLTVTNTLAYSWRTKKVLQDRTLRRNVVSANLQSVSVDVNPNQGPVL
jgi:hypothetical protein